LAVDEFARNSKETMIAVYVTRLMIGSPVRAAFGRERIPVLRRVGRKYIRDAPTANGKRPTSQSTRVRPLPDDLDNRVERECLNHFVEFGLRLIVFRIQISGLALQGLQTILLIGELLRVALGECALLGASFESL
jgi:hypothetical protein